MPKFAIHEWFKKRAEKQKKAPNSRLDVPSNLWVKCPKCQKAIFSKDLESSLKVCSSCNYHFKLSAKERISQLCEANSFKEIFAGIEPKDFLQFVDSKPYKNRIEEAQEKSGLKDAIITGEAKIEGESLGLAVMDFSYMGGSMGSVIGEKITRLIEDCIERKYPLIIISTSGGARMQEGIMSLMQMAKTSAALSRLRENKLPYISILTDPTTGGTSASFAMLGDIQIAEPNALICFAGPRVIEQTIRQKLPPGFQRSEYLLKHGMLDMIVQRQELKKTLATILKFFKD